MKSDSTLKRSALALFVFCLVISARPAYAATPELNSQLYEALELQDVDKVKALLAKGADANYKETNRPMIAWAAQIGSVEIVSALLDAKADPNAVDGIGHTALLRAIDSQQPKVVEVLLKGKANPNVADREGKTALIKAVESRKPETVQALIKGGADVTAVTADGDSPVLAAAHDAMPESFEIIKILGASKAKMNASNLVDTALTYAIGQENKELVKALLDAGADPNAKAQSGKLPLQVALGNREILDLLIQAKADPNLLNESGENALHVAIGDGKADTVEFLIKAGADVNRKTASGSTPLTLASNASMPDVVELLKKNGAAQ